MSSCCGFKALLDIMTLGVEISHRRISIPEGIVKRGSPSVGWWSRSSAKFRSLDAVVISRSWVEVGSA